MKYKFFFAAGVAGSGWSMITQQIKYVYKAKFDFTDENKEKMYRLPDHLLSEYVIHNPNWEPSTHHGTYFGPTDQYGNNFDNLSNSSVDDFYKECLRPFSAEDKPLKLIKSHWFSYNLDWLWENCKGHAMILIHRDSEPAHEWWHKMGGWDIQHPSYTWYENSEKLLNQIKKENNSILEFADRKKIQWYDWDGYGQWLAKRFNIQIPPGKVPDAVPKWYDPIKVAVFDIV